MTLTLALIVTVTPQLRWIWRVLAMDSYWREEYKWKAAKAPKNKNIRPVFLLKSF
ncbi:hypothetical protein SAMN05880574_11058 [Chryseobacterium sp. RU37D]|nr:hypothetical protein SAMN05880574_11058 [Chryseobacterium sp. RU37D]